MSSVSVLLATYNGERFVGQQLSSIAQQTLPPAELVVVDDGSTDGTLRVVQQFADTAPFPVRVHSGGKRRGYRENFVRSMELCSADLIAFCDQDDVWDPEKLAVAAAAFGDPEVLLFFHSAWLIGQDNQRLGPADIFPSPERVPPLSHHSLTSPYGFSMVFRRELTQFTHLWDRSVHSGESGKPMSHDQWIYFLASVFGTVVRSERRLVNYRQHGGNAVGYNLKSSLRSRLGRLLLFFRSENAFLSLLATAVAARADVLGACRAQLDGTWQERAEEGERRCARLGTWLLRRASIYDPAAPAPGATLAQLSREGAYQAHGGWGLTEAARRKDMLCGVLLRRFLISPATFESLRQKRPTA